MSIAIWNLLCRRQQHRFATLAGRTGCPHPQHDRLHWLGATHHVLHSDPLRLSAIHSLVGYSALRHPEHAASIQRVLAIRVKLSDRKIVTYLNDDEVDALLGACDLGTWVGRRDQVLLDVAVESGPRISELAALRRSDVTLGRGTNLHVTGKGRKERRVPLGNGAVKVLGPGCPRRAVTPPARSSRQRRAAI